MNLIGVEFTHINNIVGFGNYNLSGSGHVRVEVSRCSVEHQISILVCLPTLHKCEVTCEGFFEEIFLSLEFSDLTRLRV
jgi:hypothetical protein